MDLKSINAFLADNGLVDVLKLDPTILTDVRYASENNFTGTVLYPVKFGIFLEPELAARIVRAHARLKEILPDARFVIFDAARPLNVQYRMFDSVKGTDKEKYIAYPSGEFPGGFHNYGMAVDISIAHSDGRLFDMGTDFDSFAELAHVGNERTLLSKGEITHEVYRNRMFLYWLMAEQELLPYPYEWWHYQYFQREEDKKNFVLIDF